MNPVNNFFWICTYFVVSVTAEVRGSEVHMTRLRENTDSVATLSCILLSDGVHTCSVWIRRYISYATVYSKPAYAQ